jgi:hypothetical protein
MSVYDFSLFFAKCAVMGKGDGRLNWTDELLN